MGKVAIQDELALIGRPSLRWFVLPIRRLIYRMLQPVFVRLVDEIATLEKQQVELSQRLEAQSEQTDALINLGWDQAILLRRLAILEQQVEDLMSRIVTTQSAEVQHEVPSYLTDVEGQSE